MRMTSLTSRWNNIHLMTSQRKGSGLLVRWVDCDWRFCCNESLQGRMRCLWKMKVVELVSPQVLKKGNEVVRFSDQDQSRWAKTQCILDWSWSHRYHPRSPNIPVHLCFAFQQLSVYFLGERILGKCFGPSRREFEALTYRVWVFASSPDGALTEI